MQGLQLGLSACLIAICGSVQANEDANETASIPALRNAPVHVDIALICDFEFECLEADGCTDTTFSFEVNGKAGGLSDADMVVQAQLVSEIGDTDVLGARSGDAMSLSGGSFEARHLLTIAPDGNARYTLHYSDGPMAISYLGACK